MILCFKTLESSLKSFPQLSRLVIAELLGISGRPCLLGSRYRPKYLESSGNRAISTNTHLMGRFRRNMAHITACLSNKIDAILYAVQPVHVQTKRDTWKALLQQGSQGLRICPKHSYARTYVLSLSLLTSNKGRRRYKYSALEVVMYKCTTLLARHARACAIVTVCFLFFKILDIWPRGRQTTQNFFSQNWLFLRGSRV